jgi:hypothetical protein
MRAVIAVRDDDPDFTRRSERYVFDETYLPADVGYAVATYTPRNRVALLGAVLRYRCRTPDWLFFDGPAPVVARLTGAQSPEPLR